MYNVRCRRAVSSVWFALIAVFAASCSAPTNPSPSTNSLAEKQVYSSKGVIRAVQPEQASVTIDHEDIPGYMAAMEMVLPVADAAMINGVRVGDRVDFDLERNGSSLTIMAMTKTGEDDIVRGGDIYRVNCAECHGPIGEGVAKKGIPLTSGHALHHSEAEHIKQVSMGEGDKMPAFGSKLSEAEIKQVVNFVRNGLQKNVNREPSTKHTH